MTLKWDPRLLISSWPEQACVSSFSMTKVCFGSCLLLLLLLLLLQMTDALIQFLLLNLTPVMKLGLLCFSHYLFIKDMTRKWGCHGDGSIKSPSCMHGCIVYSFAKTAVFNRERRLFFKHPSTPHARTHTHTPTLTAPSSFFLSFMDQTMTWYK